MRGLQTNSNVFGRFGTPGLWAAAVLMAAVYFPTVQWLVHRWSLGVWFHTHGFLVFPIAIWLAYGRLKPLASRPPSASAWGFAFLVPAVLLQVADALLRFEIGSAVSFVLAIPGLCLLLLGRERFRAILFPLFFLVFAVPIPLMVVRKVHLALRYVAAFGTEQSLSFMGYDVTREGTLLQVGPESIQIADACSGFSTLMALLMLGMLVVYTTRMAPWRRVLVLLVVFPAAALANLARCVLLSMLVTAYGPEILDTFVHPLSGFMTFAIAFALLFLVERLLQPARLRPEVTA